MSYSLKQAADATGKERLTLQRAIKRGRISATLGESGAYEIDPSELHRVFPPVARNQAQPIATQQETASENRELKAKVELLREMVDDLRERLDKSEDERRATQTKLTALLTHQPKPEPEAQPAPTPEPQPQQGQAANQKPRRGFWAALKDWV